MDLVVGGEYGWLVWRKQAKVEMKRWHMTSTLYSLSCYLFLVYVQ
jgi:hypothetical protein